MSDWLPKLPLADWTEAFVDFLRTYFQGLFDVVSDVIGAIVDFFVFLMSSVPALVVILIIAAIAWYTSRWTIALFTVIGLLLIENLGYWDGTVQTIALVLTSILITFIIGVPLGI